MSNVISLTGIAPTACGEPHEGLIRSLEQLLAMAKAGALQSLIGAGFLSNGARASVWAGYHESYYEQLGSLVALQTEFAEKGAGL